MAQNVYRLTVAGYIGIQVVDGFNLIANQLDFDGTGLHNTPANVLGTNLPVNTSIYGWSSSNTWNIATFAQSPSTGTNSWEVTSGDMPTLNPGQGLWLFMPYGGSHLVPHQA